MDENSIHWGGHAGVRLNVSQDDPLPDPILGGLELNSFLAEYLLHSTNPLAAGLGLLTTLDSTSSTVSKPWSVDDPNSSFYDEVFDLLFRSPGPAMPSDALRQVPRLIHHDMVATSVQHTGSSAISESVHQSVHQVILACNVFPFIFNCI